MKYHLLFIALAVIFTVMPVSLCAQEDTDGELRWNEFLQHIEELEKQHIEALKKDRGIQITLLINKGVKTNPLYETAQLAEPDIAYISQGEHDIRNRCLNNNGATRKSTLCEYLIGEDDTYSAGPSSFFDISLVSLIRNSFFNGVSIYRIQDVMVDMPTFGAVFAVTHDSRQVYTTHLTSDSFHTNNLPADQVENNFNALVKRQHDFAINDSNILKYVLFFLYLTSEYSGEYVMYTPEHIKKACFYIGIPCEWRTPDGEMPDNFAEGFAKVQPKAKRYEADGVNYFTLQFMTTNRCGIMTYRDITIAQNGIVKINKLLSLNDYPAITNQPCSCF